MPDNTCVTLSHSNVNLTSYINLNEKNLSSVLEKRPSLLASKDTMMSV